MIPSRLFASNESKSRYLSEKYSIFSLRWVKKMNKWWFCHDYLLQMSKKVDTYPRKIVSWVSVEWKSWINDDSVTIICIRWVKK